MPKAKGAADAGAGAEAEAFLAGLTAEKLAGLLAEVGRPRRPPTNFGEEVLSGRDRSWSKKQQRQRREAILEQAKRDGYCTILRSYDNISFPYERWCYQVGQPFIYCEKLMKGCARVSLSTRPCRWRWTEPMNDRVRQQFAALLPPWGKGEFRSHALGVFIGRLALDDAQAIARFLVQLARSRNP